MWFIIGTVYFCISMPLFIIVYYNCSGDYDFTLFNIYAILYRRLAEKYNTLGTWIPLISFIIFCLPYNVIYLALMSVFYGALCIVDYIIEIWDKMFGRHK